MHPSLRLVALVAVLVAGVLAGVSFAPDGPDTGPEVADRIHRGMTVDEAAAVIGVPPGDYRLKADQTPYFLGFKFPHGTVRYRWAGYRGYIYVVGGRYRDGRTTLDVTDYVGREVYSVEWAPVEQHPEWWRLRSPVALAAAVVAGALMVVRVFRAPTPRQAGDVPPPGPSPA